MNDPKYDDLKGEVVSFDEEHRDDHELCAHEIHTLQERIRELEAALLNLYSGTAEYIYLNHLGDPNNTTPMRNAAKVLGASALQAYDRLAALYSSSKEPGG